MVKAKAVWEALLWCLDLWYKRVVVELDLLRLINMLNQMSYKEVEAERILFDIVCLTQQFHKVDFVFAL